MKENASSKAQLYTLVLQLQFKSSCTSAVLHSRDICTGSQVMTVKQLLV
jgi:hypothetical protein